MKGLYAMAALAALFSTGAFAQDGADRSLASAPVEHYHYGMQLDVKKVISKTDVSQESGVVPVTMVYEDSKGQVHKLEYLQLGGYDNQANG